MRKIRTLGQAFGTSLILSVLLPSTAHAHDPISFLLVVGIAPLILPFIFGSMLLARNRKELGANKKWAMGLFVIGMLIIHYLILVGLYSGRVPEFLFFLILWGLPFFSGLTLAWWLSRKLRSTDR